MEHLTVLLIYHTIFLLHGFYGASGDYNNDNMKEITWLSNVPYDGGRLWVRQSYEGNFSYTFINRQNYF